MPWIIPEDSEIPEELWDQEVTVNQNSWQPADQSVGIMNGYWEQIWLTTNNKSIEALLEEHGEYLAEKYDDELQECEDDGFYDEPPHAYEPPQPNFENTQATGWWL